MKNRLISCFLACLMIFLVGCSGNTAKEAAQENHSEQTVHIIIVGQTPTEKGVMCMPRLLTNFDTKKSK